MSRRTTTDTARHMTQGIAATAIRKPLTPVQRRVLAAAAERSDRAVLPLPEGMAQRGAITQRLIAGLLDRRLIEEVPCRAVPLPWRTDANRRHLALRITAAGIAAIDGEAASPLATATIAAGETAAIASTAAVGAPAVAVETSTTAPFAIPGGKLGEVLAATSAPQGATIAELVALTGWLPHTTRAALTRLRQRGHALRLISTDARKAYRLDQVGAADASVAPAAAVAAQR